MKRWITIIIGLCCSAALYGGILFSGLDLKEPGELLFKAEAESPGFGTFGTLFTADIKTRKLQQLTFFPEAVIYLRETGQLQIQNRFGVFRTDANLANIEPVSIFPSFVNGMEIQEGKIVNVTSSPDGNYLVYFKPISPAYADLVLFDLQQGKEVVLSRKLLLSYTSPGALWSGDSQFLVYTKDGTLYYYSLGQYRDGRVLAEDFRVLGKGRIENVQWSSDGWLYYVSGSLVYQVRSAEFFTRSLYSELLRIGRIIGKIPFNFDPNFDRFWISPDGKKILLDKGGRNLFLYYLSQEDYSNLSSETILPYLYLPRNTRIREVLWSKSDNIIILTGGRAKGEDSTTLFRLNLDKRDAPLYFEKMSDTGVTRIVLSQQGDKIVLVTGEGVTVREMGTWKELSSLKHPQPLSCVWKDEETLIISGMIYTEEAPLKPGNNRLIALSQPGTAGFTVDKGAVGLKTEAGSFLLENREWKRAESLTIRVPQAASSEYRVYLEKIFSYAYENMIMVRNLKGLGTNTLFPYPKKTYDPFPEKEETVDFVHFAHGSRIRAREVSLVFNAIDSVEGLNEILHTLAEYNLRATFFINGEFIRRNPDAVKEIALSGHEAGSLFYVYFDMTDSRFRVNSDFVKQGLARNEDDYFEVTGKELSLLWHAPYYAINTEIINASKDMNYTYVGRDVDPLDWVTLSDRTVSSGLYLRTPDMIERVLRLKKPGSIISIQIGQLSGTREDYLFKNLDLLVNGLMQQGYSLVPVSALIEKAR